MALAVGLISLSGAASAADGRMVVAQADKPAGKGTINTVDAAARKLNMTHGPIPALKWEGMTMDFVVAPGLDMTGLKPEAKVGFTLGRAADGMYVIDTIKPE